MEYMATSYQIFQIRRYRRGNIVVLRFHRRRTIDFAAILIVSSSIKDTRKCFLISSTVAAITARGLAGRCFRFSQPVHRRLIRWHHRQAESTQTSDWQYFAFFINFTGFPDNIIAMNLNTISIYISSCGPPLGTGVRWAWKRLFRGSRYSCSHCGHILNLRIVVFGLS